MGEEKRKGGRERGGNGGKKNKGTEERGKKREEYDPMFPILHSPSFPHHPLLPPNLPSSLPFPLSFPFLPLLSFPPYSSLLFPSAVPLRFPYPSSSFQFLPLYLPFSWGEGGGGAPLKLIGKKI